MHFTKSLAILGTLFLSATILNAQEMKKEELLDMPFAKVKSMMANPAEKTKLMEMAKKDNVPLMGGVAVEGKEVTLKGELTGANCYLSRGIHGHDHALCAKACVAAGSPVIFIEDSGKVYTVLPPKDGTPLPEAALDDLGRPGITIEARLVAGHGEDALALESVRR